MIMYPKWSLPWRFSHHNANVYVFLSVHTMCQAQLVLPDLFTANSLLWWISYFHFCKINFNKILQSMMSPKRLSLRYLHQNFVYSSRFFQSCYMLNLSCPSFILRNITFLWNPYFISLSILIIYLYSKVSEVDEDFLLKFRIHMFRPCVLYALPSSSSSFLFTWSYLLQLNYYHLCNIRFKYILLSAINSFPLRATCPAYLCLGVLRSLLGCRRCSLGLCQLLCLRVHLALRVASLLLQVAHDHLFAR